MFQKAVIHKWHRDITDDPAITMLDDMEAELLDQMYIFNWHPEKARLAVLTEPKPPSIDSTMLKMSVNSLSSGGHILPEELCKTAAADIAVVNPSISRRGVGMIFDEWQQTWSRAWGRPTSHGLRTLSSAHIHCIGVVIFHNSYICCFCLSESRMKLHSLQDSKLHERIVERTRRLLVSWYRYLTTSCGTAKLVLMNLRSVTKDTWLIRKSPWRW